MIYRDFTEEEREKLAVCPLCGRILRTEKTQAMSFGQWFSCKCGFKGFCVMLNVEGTKRD